MEGIELDQIFYCHRYEPELSFDSFVETIAVSPDHSCVMISSSSSTCYAFVCAVFAIYVNLCDYGRLCTKLMEVV